MCKRAIRETPRENKENSNVNVGLLNMSNENFSDGLNVAVILQYVIAAILMIMVAKWMKKCWNRRQQRLFGHLTQHNVGQIGQPALPAPAPVIPTAPAAPVVAPAPQPVPIILHHSHSARALMPPDEYNMVDRMDKMEKYRT